MASNALRLLAETYARNDRNQSRCLVTPETTRCNRIAGKGNAKDAEYISDFSISYTATPVTPKNEHDRAAIEVADLAPKRLHKRMTSWARPEDAPKQGDYCGCCSGQFWWIEDDRSKGWRCGRCYPGNHLPADRRRDVMTCSEPETEQA